MKKKIHIFSLRLTVIIIIFSISHIGAVYGQEKLNLTLTYDGQTSKYSELGIKLVINGAEVTGLSMPPIIFNNYTLVPARDVLELMGATVSWDPKPREVNIVMGSNITVLKINDTTARVNNVEAKMDIPPKIINERTMIPLRFVADNLNFLVYWEESSRTIYIDDLGHGQNLATGQDGASNTGSEISEDYGYIVNTQNEDSQSADIGVNINSNTSMTTSDTLIAAKDKSVSQILTENHPETSITEIIQPQNGNNYFRITAVSAISKIEKTLLGDNRMYLDIYGAVLNTSQSAYSFTDNPNVASVRAAQNQTEPVKIVRIVFDLKDGAEYYVDLSADRKIVTVGFERNKIKDFIFKSNYSTDILTIVGTSTPSVTIYPMENPERLIIDVPYADLEKAEEMIVAGEFTSAVRSVQYDQNTARMILDLNKKVSYNLTTDGNTAVITMFSPSYKNIDYDFVNKRIVLSKNSAKAIDIRQFIHKDDYSLFQYTITIPVDLSGYFGQGEHVIRDSYLNSISVQTSGGQTTITINETRVLAYNVYEDLANIYIQPVHPKEKYDKIVVLDPGHGGDDPGTSSANGLIERDVNLDIAMRLHELLEKDGRVKVYSTRLTDIKPSYESRAQFGTENGDLFVSIHQNYAEIRPGVSNPSPNGTETFYYPHDNDSQIGFTSEQAATILQKNVSRTLNSNNRGIKKNYLQVLTLNKVPAVLCEVGFFSNQDEAAKLATMEYRQKAAQGLFEGIIDIFQQYTPKR